ncbi:hypothetical protein [Pontibacter pamirensis]|uniref:hypothetical protein n=1 Tax=Pontibacter pamirensis TaxID=2562824 RepID=UPI00138984BB|nr:hypothetical protein [Pontibacter pamirensis]
MANKPMNTNGSEGENHEIGRKLYNKDKQYNQQNDNQRYGNRREDTREWGEGNYFHTGPNPRGAQDPDRDRNRNFDRNRNDDRRGGASNSSYNQGQNAHLNDHYGSRSDSSYRNERSFINHGDRNQYQHDESHSMRRPHTSGGSLQGNQEDVRGQQNDPWREGPGSGSRYKESDYRYGSGSHNWYTEDRYTPNDDNNRRNNPRHDDRGFMDRMKDTWNDIWHSDDEDYQSRGDRYQSNADRLDTRKRYGSEQYRDRNFDKGLEGGPRWADETDSGQDNYFDDRDNTNRYRR